MRLLDVDPLTQPGLLAAWADVGRACGEHEFGDRHTVYSADELREEARLTQDHLEHVLAVDDAGRPLGRSLLRAPTRDNLHAVVSQVQVVPQARRSGVGTALARDVERRARALGRQVVRSESDVATGSEPGVAAFAQPLGYRPAQRSLRQDLDVAAATDPLPAAPDGYRLTTYAGAVPEHLLDQRAVLAGRMSTDAPMGELEQEPEVWDAARVRRSLEIAAAQGRVVVETVAAAADGTLVAFTTMAVAEHTPDVAYQWDTLVLREHRGHRLGRRVKDANLRALRAAVPGVRRVVTWNAEDNAWMLAVNRGLGFAETGVFVEWQRRLEP